MKNKKGFLLGEYTLKIIIAVLCILLLLYLLSVLYSSFTDEKNFNRAKETLDNLNEKMVDAKTSAVSLPLLEPNGWRLISYIGLEKPEACTKNCICLCEDVKTGRFKKAYIWADTQIEKCNIRGVCKNFDDKIEEFNIKLRNNVDIEYKDEGFVISESENENEE